MKPRHCDEGSNHITLMDSDYKIASLLAMKDYLPFAEPNDSSPCAIGRIFEIIGYSGASNLWK